MEKRTDLRRIRPWGLVLPALCMLALVGCVDKQIQLFDTAGTLDISVVPATTNPDVVVKLKPTAKEPAPAFDPEKSGVSIFIEDPASLVIDEAKAEDWLIQLVNDPPKKRKQADDEDFAEEVPWAEGTLGEFIIPRAGLQFSDANKVITFKMPAILGLLSEATVMVKVAGVCGTDELILNPPPSIQKVTRVGDINGAPYDGPFIVQNSVTGELEVIPAPTDNEMYTDVKYAVVPSQVASVVAVDGRNIDAGAGYTWVLEGDELGAAKPFANGRYAWSPELATEGSHARVGIKVTNADGQSDLLDLALLATEPPMIYTTVRTHPASAVGANLPWSAQEVPAEIADATIKICGKGFDLIKCEYVAFTDPATDAELGRYYVPWGDTHDNDDDAVDLNDGSDYTDCILDVVTPVVKGLVAPKAVQVTAHFADGSYTYNEALLDMIPAPIIASAVPESVPATPIDNDATDPKTKIKLSGPYLHQSSAVLPGWAFTAYNENSFLDDLSQAIGEANPDEWITEPEVDWEKVGDTYTLTFTRPALTMGTGSYSSPVIAKGLLSRDLVREDRDVRFIVRDGYGQVSRWDANPEEAQVTYNAPPQIYNFQIEDKTTPATREQKFLLTGWNWKSPEITFVRQDNGVELLSDMSPETTLEGGVQVYSAVTPLIENPPYTDQGINVVAYIKNEDGQRVSALFSYDSPNANPLTVVSNSHGYPEVGATEANPAIVAALNKLTFGRQVTITGFNKTAVLVEFLDAEGKLIENPGLNDNPIDVKNANWISTGTGTVTVKAPVLPTNPAADTLVYVRVTNDEGQVTPKQYYGVLTYKPAPTAVAVSIDNYTADKATIPASKRIAKDSLNTVETHFTLTGTNMQSNMPYVRLAAQERSYLAFRAYRGDAEPGSDAFGGYIDTGALEGQWAKVYFEGAIATGTGMGDVPELLGVTINQECEKVVFYDLYGQACTVTPAINVVAPPVVKAFAGRFKNHKGEEVTKANLTPGRGGNGAPQFVLTGKNLGSVEVALTVAKYDTDFPSGLIGAWAAATLSGAEAVGPMPQAEKADLPKTRTDVTAIVRGTDGQAVKVPNVVFTAPPQIIANNTNPATPGITGNTNITANAIAQSFTLNGYNLNIPMVPPLPADAFAVASSTATDLAGKSQTLGTLGGYDTALVTLADYENADKVKITTKFVGQMPITYTNYCGQINESAPSHLTATNGDPIEMSLLNDNLYLRTLCANNDLQVVVTGKYTSTDQKDLIAVSIGNAPPKGGTATDPDVRSLKIEVWHGVTANGMLLEDSNTKKSLLLVQTPLSPRRQ